MFSTRLLAVLAVAKMVSAANTTTAALTPAQILNAEAKVYTQDFYNYIFIVLASLIAALIIWRVFIETTKHIRTLACLNNDTQRYFTKPADSWASFKKHLLYAPVFSKRHNREIQLSPAVNVGTLPTRFQLMFLIGYFGTNVAFCIVSIDWNQPRVTAAKELRNRTGVLAVVNMVSHTGRLAPLESRSQSCGKPILIHEQVPLFIMAARNNPLISWLNLSFDSFNLLHRWFGRIVVLEAIAHTVAWGVSVQTWAEAQSTILSLGMETYGFMVSAPYDLMN